MASSNSTGDSPRRKKSFGRGTPLRSQTREIVCNVREYFEREKENGAPLLPVARAVQRTAEATKINRSTVIGIGKEKYFTEELAGTSRLETPGKNRRRLKPVTELDTFQQDAIRRHIYAYYHRKEHPTLQKLLRSLNESSLFHGGKSSLKKIINNLGFRYKKVNGRRVLLERSDIVTWRCKFLREVIQQNFDSIVWLDETWVNASHSRAKGWTDDSVEGTMPVPIGKGGRIIVIHAGTSQGFVPNCLHIFRSKKTGDYHEEMNSVTFQKWFEEKLLHNLPDNSVIVMDNAPYHSVILDKAPTMAARKSELIDWLKAHNIEVQDDMRKGELIHLVKQNKPQFPVYVIDELARRHGHKVIRLPPYHCHFNAIELIWAQVKNDVAANNRFFTITEVERLLSEALCRVSAENWKKVVNHTKLLINDAWEKEGIVDEYVENFIISLGSSESDSSTDDDNGSSDSDLSGVFPL